MMSVDNIVRPRIATMAASGAIEQGKSVKRFARYVAATELKFNAANRAGTKYSRLSPVTVELTNSRAPLNVVSSSVRLISIRRHVVSFAKNRSSSEIPQAKASVQKTVGIRC